MNINNEENQKQQQNTDLKSIALKLEQREELRTEEKRKNKKFNEEKQLDLNTTDIVKEIINNINVLYKECNDKLDKLHSLDTKNDSDKIQNEIQDVTSLISLMKELFQEHSIILPPFELKNITNTISKIENTLQETKNIVIPKPKFLFTKKKKSATTPSESKTKSNTLSTSSTNNTTPTESIKKEPTLNHERIYNQINKTINFPDDIIKETIDQPSSIINDVSISFIENCNITINSILTSLKIDQITNNSIVNSKVEIDGSVFIDSCKNVKFYLKSRQIRIHNCFNCEFYINTKSHPIIEACKDIGFAPFTPLAKEETQDSTDNNDQFNQFWNKVNDFDWLQQNKQSPNWYIIEFDKREYL